MSEKIYLLLLFLCGILCQEIFAKIPDKDSQLSSDFLVRKRRVINNLPEGQSLTRIESINYFVRIMEGNRVLCAGAILSHYTVITAAPCVIQHLGAYKIYSGAAGATGHKVHNVTSKIIHDGNPPHQELDGIALITVDPPFVFGRKTGNIELYQGPLPTGTMVTVFGWGFNYPIQPGLDSRKRVRKIILPIMNHSECRTIYSGRFSITDKHICTYHEQQYCAYNDAGAPLVFNDRLAGIHIWKGENPNERNPDVFINLLRPDYSQWIMEHSLLM